MSVAEAAKQTETAETKLTEKTNQRTVYLLSILHRDLDKGTKPKNGTPIKIYSNLDSAIKKALDIHFDDEQVLDTLVAFSNIAFDSSNTTSETEDVKQAAIEILHKIINQTYDYSHQHISKKLFLKVKHLIPNLYKYNQQDLYYEWVDFYVGRWKKLFFEYSVTNDNIQTKIQEIVDNRNDFYQIKHESGDVPKKLTKYYLKKRYPKLFFENGRYSSTFEFSIDSFIKEVFGFNISQIFIIEPFVLDED